MKYPQVFFLSLASLFILCAPGQTRPHKPTKPAAPSAKQDLNSTPPATSEAAPPQPVPSAKEAEATASIESAKRCDQETAEKYLKAVNEPADTVAVAAFDKCAELWAQASKSAIAYQSINISSMSQKDVAGNPYLLPETIRKNEAIEKQNSIETWREAEIKRLRILIIEKRLETNQN
ncbi:MAG: hypothetical protein ACKOPC_06540 [Methylocystis sp.]